MSTLIISISAMCCPAEGGPVEQVLRAAPGVADVTLDYSTRTARVTGDRLSGEALLEALLSIGMPGELVVTGARRIVLSVPEMDCPVEAGEIQKAFAAAGITGADFNVMTRTVTLSGDDDLEAAAVRAVESCGYTAKAAASGPGTIESAPIPWALYISALFVAFMSEAIELVSEYSPGLIPLEHGTIDLITLALAVVAILMAGLEVFKNGVLALVHRNLNMNALMAVAVVGGVLIGAWPEAAMVMVLFQISESIEQLSMTKARRSIRDLMSAAPETAEVKDGRSWRRVPSSDVGAGAVVRVGPGDRVPLDGRIVRGATALDQSMVTGEGMPAEKSEGDNVWSGTVNLTSTIEVMVTAAASESLTARIIDAVENAQASKSPVQRFVDRFAAVYTPIVFFIAAAVAIVPGLVTGEWSTWIYRALCLLVISCPCALVISTPVTVVSALATATRCGLLIKGGLYLEEARKLVNIGLDKTGTLTKGEPAVAGVKYLATFDERLTGAMAASLAAMNKHPLSQAIARWAHERHLPVYQVEGFTAIPGAGVEGRIERGMVRLVNLRWLEEQGLADEEVRRTFAHYTNEGMSAVAVADAFGVQAVFGLADVVKEDTVEGLRQLASVGIRPWLLTGDNEAAAHALAEKVGLKDVRADLLPEDKLKAIEELQKSGLTAMAGDGINDAPALARADIGIAMGVRGTDSAIEAAHIAVMDDRISSIATLVRLSRITHGVLVENIAFAIGVKIIFALLALTGNATMWMAVFADTGTCLIVVANAMRMLRMKPRLDRMAEEARRAA
jgi:Cd2+/Zn2+-exporting ATPase